MDVYQYPQSQALFELATQIIPAGIYGHLGPGEGCFIPVEAYPFYASHAKGAYFWDLDGNRFIDYLCAYGPNVLGYGDESVDRAYNEQAAAGNCLSLPTRRMVELAEMLVATVASADWAFFAKNGGDVTNLAMLTARAATGRRKVVKLDGGYHGVAPWMTALGYPGVLEEDLKHVISIPFNDVAAFERAIAENPDDIACFIGTPYHHPAFGDSELPQEGYWQKMRELCSKHGIVLILDDVRCGFRLDLAGSDHYFGFKADLICFCKALANGYNISALCGRAELKSAVASIFYTGSYWLSAAPMAAALACLRRLHELDAARLMQAQGQKLIQGLEAAARDAGFRLKATGVPSMFFMRLENDPSCRLHQAFIGECVRRGAFLANHHNLFVNCALSDEDIALTAEIAADAFHAVRREHADLLA